MSGEMSVAGKLPGFSIVMINVDSSHTSIALGLKDLMSMGRGKRAKGTTVNVAAVGNSLFPLVVSKESAGIEFTKLPAFSARITKVMVHLPKAGMEAASSKVTVTGVIFGGEAVTLPPQVVLGLPTSVRPAGNISTKSMVKSAASALLLIRVIVTFEVPPAVMVNGSKLLLIIGVIIAADMTVKVAAVGATLSPWSVCKSPAAMEFI